MGLDISESANETRQTSRGIGPVPRWLQLVFVANVIAQTGIILTGAIVRLTGSGLGCPTWPECTPGSIVPTAAQVQPTIHKFIEFGNRTLTGVLGVLAIAALLGMLLNYRAGNRRRPLLALSAIPLLGTIGQAVLGGVTVLTGLNPVVVGAHMVLSFLIVAACVTLVVRSKESGDVPLVPTVRREMRYLAWALMLVGFVVVVLGTVVTGSGPHSGDTTAARYPFDPRYVAWLHADSVLLFIGLMIGFAVGAWATDAPALVRRRVAYLIGLSIAQGALGYTQYFLGVPWLLVACHVLGATLVWIVSLGVLLATRERGVEPASV